jgi:hypothetical protein
MLMIVSFVDGLQKSDTTVLGRRIRTRWSMTLRNVTYIPAELSSLRRQSHAQEQLNGRF